MKVTATQYAKSLYELTKEKSHKEIDGIVANFFKVLVKNRQQKLFAKIIERFSDIANKEQGIVEAEVATSRKLESEQVHKVESYIKERYSAKEVVLKNKIDVNIKGGIIIRVNDEVIDASIVRQLRDLRDKLAS